VILHGYGANGENLISLGQEFVKILPNAYFIAPNAPQVNEGIKEAVAIAYAVTNNDFNTLLEKYKRYTID
jgi:predicted esterase